MSITCGICEKKASWMIKGWMINGIEPACDEHLIRALDGYDKVELERIKTPEEQIIVR